jgi:hypothetical protein
MTLAEYFAQTSYKATYHLGDRIIGRHQGTPFIGTVGNDNQLNPTDGPFITVHLDLPIMIDEEIKNVIIVKHHEINRLRDFDSKETNEPSLFDSVHKPPKKQKKIEKVQTRTESLLDRLKAIKGKK